MSSLRQLLAVHPRFLLIDTASAETWVAVWRPFSESDGVCSFAARLPAIWASVRPGEASAWLAPLVTEAFAAAGFGLEGLDAAVFCHGPGSVLGIRLAAATLRAWRAMRPDMALYAYESLGLLAVAHPSIGLVVDARRESWHYRGAALGGRLERVASERLAVLGPLGTPRTFRRWSAPPPGVVLRELDYDPPALLAEAPDADLFLPTPEPDLWMTEAPVYATWTPRVHQAPEPRS